MKRFLTPVTILLWTLMVGFSCEKEADTVNDADKNNDSDTTSQVQDTSSNTPIEEDYSIFSLDSIRVISHITEDSWGNDFDKGNNPDVYLQVHHGTSLKFITRTDTILDFDSTVVQYFHVQEPVKFDLDTLSFLHVKLFDYDADGVPYDYQPMDYVLVNLSGLDDKKKNQSITDDFKTNKVELFFSAE